MESVWGGGGEGEGGIAYREMRETGGRGRCGEGGGGKVWREGEGVERGGGGCGERGV